MKQVSGDGLRKRKDGKQDKDDGATMEDPVEHSTAAVTSDSPADADSERPERATVIRKRKNKTYDDPITFRDIIWPTVFCVAFCLLMLFMAMNSTVLQLPPALKPIGGKKVKWISQFQGGYRNSMLWGTYRPGYYFGARFRMPESLLVGLMWYDATAWDGLQHVRHEARQEDGLQRYGWTRHDGTFFGQQEILDGSYNITTTWMKRFCAGCGRGGDWALNVKVQENESQEEEDNEDADTSDKISLIFYVADEIAVSFRGHGIQLLPEGPITGSGGVLARGNTFPLDIWELRVHDNTGGSGLRDVHYRGESTGQFHNLTEILKDNMALVIQRAKGEVSTSHSFQLTDTVEKKPSVAFFQVTAKLPLDLDFVFMGGMKDEKTEEIRRNVRGFFRTIFRPIVPQLARVGLDFTEDEEPTEDQESLEQRAAAMTGPALSQLVTQGQQDFDEHFEEVFGALKTKELPEGTRDVMSVALSNLIGGIGFFYGHTELRYKDREESAGCSTCGFVKGRLKDTGLLTAVPSRSFFPRGFLWDEGFHQLLIQRWAPLLSRDIIGHWFDLMNEEGYIAREQILGEEAKMRVPAEFIVQNNQQANPPTLILPLLHALPRVIQAVKEWKMEPGTPVYYEGEFMAALYWRLLNWFNWYHRSQAGPVAGSFQWKGRNRTTQAELNPKTFASGFDDYPRSSHPTLDERHVDLRCWMAIFARGVAEIGKVIGWKEPEEVARIEAIASELENFDQLNALHWDADREQYADWGYHTEEVKLQQKFQRRPDGTIERGEMLRVVKTPPKLGFVPHFGYVSLFPFLTKLLPADSPQLLATLKKLHSPAHLWTPYGLRSLSRSSSLYGKRNTEHDPPYWRGAIWMNINYLSCGALWHYSKTEGPHQHLAQEIYTELRSNLINNVVQQYHDSGYLWEQYNDQTGKGQFSHPFTGWTSLILLIAAELY